MKSISFPRRLLLLFISLLLGLQLGACSRSDSGNANNTGAATLNSVQIGIENNNIVQGLTTRASAVALYSDNSRQDKSGAADWFSLNSQVASIDSAGVITALAPGSTVISAVVDGEIGSAPLTVVAADLIGVEITPADPQLAVGVQQQFRATGIYTNGAANLRDDITDQVSWLSSAPGTVSVADSGSDKGLATTVSAGNAEISATLEGVSSSVAVAVTSATLTGLEISATQTTLPAGSTLQLQATGVYDDASRQDLSQQVSWSSDDDTIVTVGDAGLLTALAAGSVTVAVNFQGRSASLEFDISAAALSQLEISPGVAELVPGETLQLHAIALYVDGTRLDVTEQATWSSASQGVATVGNSASDRGLLNALTAGSSVLGAHYDGLSASAAVSVSAATLQGLEIRPSNPGIAAGTQQGFRALGHYDDGSTRDLTDQVSWASSEKAVAEVLSDPGFFRGLAAGTARITAVLDDGVSAFTDLQVSNATLQSISLSPGPVTIARGFSTRLTATGQFSDASSQDITRSVVWESGAPAVASVANSGADSGLLRALSAGNTTVSASLSGISQGVAVTVSDAQLTGLSLQLDDDTMIAGTRQSATATAQFSDSTSLDVSAAVIWSSSQAGVASISNGADSPGLITALSGGQTTLGASLGQHSDSATLTVTEDPDAAVSLSLLAAPNVLLNDGADSSTVTVTLRPADSSGSIADNTPVEIEISEGNSTSQQTLTTTGGTVSFAYTTNYSGFVTIRASVASSAITARTHLYTTPDFANIIAYATYQDVQYAGNELVAGSLFALLVKNLSNRDFVIDQYLFSNGATSRVRPGNEVSGGVLAGSELYGVVVSLGDQQPDNGISGVLSLHDATTGQAFDISATFTTP